MLTKHRMSMKKLGSKGFSAIEGLLIFVIVGIIGGVGYYLFSSQKDKVTDENSIVATTEAEADSDQGAFVVKEWDVKIPKDSVVAGIEYSIKPNGVAYFRSTELNKYAVGDLNCENSVYVVRGMANEKVISTTSDGDETFEAAYSTYLAHRNDAQATTRDIAVKIGNYYYIPPGFAGASCVGADAEDQKKELSAMLDIVKAINAMVAN